MRSQDRFRLHHLNRIEHPRDKLKRYLNGAAKTVSTKHSSAIKCAILFG
jgi:hypothetical protein